VSEPPVCRRVGQCREGVPISGCIALVLPAKFRQRFSTAIKDVAPTGNSGSGVFDANLKCLLGVMSRKFFVTPPRRGQTRNISCRRQSSELSCRANIAFERNWCMLRLSCDLPAGLAGSSRALAAPPNKGLRLFCPPLVFAPERAGGSLVIRSVEREWRTRAVDNNYATQKFYQAVDALIGPESLQMRLTYAIDSLIALQARDLPLGLHGDFKELRQALTREPLSDSSGILPRKLDDDEASRLATEILRIYTKLVRTS
jgi:hypothetical protein